MKALYWLKAGLIPLLTWATLTQTPAVAGGKPDVVIGYENNGADPYMVSMGEKLFEKNMNANIQYKFFSSGPAAMSALASNSLNFMCGIGIPPLVAAISQGLPMAIIYNQERYTNAAGIVVKPKSGIQSVSDLKGRKIAIVAGSQASFELATFLKEARVPYDSVIQINMAPPQMRASWLSGDIDAAIVWDPVFGALRESGGHVIKTDADLPRSASSYNVCIVNSEWAKDHKDVAVGFVKALDEGVKMTKDEPTKAIKIMAKLAGVTVPLAKSELSGYEVFSGKDQISGDVMGSGASIHSSATYQTLVNTSKVLHEIGRIPSTVESFDGSLIPQYSEPLSH
ncbi:taurine ABC transporter substrate-binding protein [Thiomonas sp.]